MQSLDEFIAKKLEAIGIDSEVQFSEIPIDQAQPFNPYLQITCPTCGGLLVQ